MAENNDNDVTGGRSPETLVQRLLRLQVGRHSDARPRFIPGDDLQQQPVTMSKLVLDTLEQLIGESPLFRYIAR